MAPSRGGMVIFSGGTAANSLVDVFESIRKSRSSSISYIIPISDNGGSSSELIRVFGGPGIGDVRSRLIRLIPLQPYSQEREVIGTLLSHRLSGSDTRDARNEWADVVDGTSPLWNGISSAKKELIRSFFNLVNLEILKRSRPPTSTFDFRSASIGNFLLTGARLFSGSFESAIYLLSAVCGIPDEEVKVIPSINSNFSHHIAAELEDGSVIVGQNSISHPSPNVDHMGGSSQTETKRPQSDIHDAAVNNITSSATPTPLPGMKDDVEAGLNAAEEEDAHPPFTLPTLRTSNITFSKAAEELVDLPSKINRIYYVNSFGQEILPPANPRAVQALQHAEAIIYSIGSLYTSIVPNLVLRGVGQAMHKSQASLKILILNGCLDREVGPDSPGRPFTAADFIDAIARAGEQSRGVVWSPNNRACDQNAQHSTTEAAQRQSRRPSLQRAKSEGVSLVSQSQTTRARLLPPPMLASAMPSRVASPSSSPDRPSCQTMSTTVSNGSANSSNAVYKHYVTHLIHLPNSEGTPWVDQEHLASHYGVKCIRVYGRRNKHGPGMLYDTQALRGAIEAVLGGRSQDKTSRADDDETGSRMRLQERERGRRNTVER
ncbi:hypothetical protein LTR64_002944 [Lithohypha guttulata]|uniref:uncharacterized protein n=1 Tax=Lithohypha guttulata TaxID=1690604 RepID=UPI002DDF9D64|nr:hypothetical protein LTR51_000831 [Lithohypha guttulata]